MTRDNLLLPHPVLRPGGGLDYSKDCDFGLEMRAGDTKRTSEGLVRIEAAFTLASITLEEMIKKGEARYLLLATCTKTYYRHVASFNTRQVQLEVPVSDLAGTLRLTPYVVASEELEWFIAPEHDLEIKKFKGNDKIPAGAILAIGAPHEIEMEQIGTIMSAIKLIPNDKIEEGRYEINDRGDFVIIELSNKTHMDVVRMRPHIKDVLYPSVYQAAIEYALRKIDDEPDTKWAKALQKTLEEHGVKLDDVKENENHYAQLIMGNPFGQMLEWYNRGGHLD